MGHLFVAQKRLATDFEAPTHPTLSQLLSHKIRRSANFMKFRNVVRRKSFKLVKWSVGWVLRVYTIVRTEVNLWKTTLAEFLKRLRTSLICNGSYCEYPDKPFHNSGASISGDQQILCSSGTSCDGFWSSKIVKRFVGMYLETFDQELWPRPVGHIGFWNRNRFTSESSHCILSPDHIFHNFWATKYVDRRF